LIIKLNFCSHSTDIVGKLLRSHFNIVVLELMVWSFQTAEVHLVTTKEKKESWFAVSIMLH